MRKNPILPDRTYHIFNRGVNKEPIFYHRNDWDIFVYKLKKYFPRDQVLILAYCLMPNHYHLLVHVVCEGFSDLIMHPFSASYARTTNLRAGRVGPLFQGRFQAKQVEGDESVMHISRYIHMNPVTAGLVSDPLDWKYSSYSSIINNKDEIVAVGEMLNYFSGVDQFAEFTQNVDSSDAKIPFLDV